jgi:hypothetical protein
MDRLFALFWHVLLTGHVVVTAVGFFVATDVDGLGFFVIGFLLGFFVAASTTAMNTTNVTRRIAKNFIVGWIVLLTEK